MLVGVRKERCRPLGVLNGLTFAVDDYPAVIFGGVLCDLLARELHGLLVVAIAIHFGEAYSSICIVKGIRLSALYRCAVYPIQAVPLQ